MIKDLIHSLAKHEDVPKDVDEAYRKGYNDALNWVIKHLESEWDCSNEDNIPYYLREMISRKIRE